MKARAYIETTIPSFYFETRTEPDMVARRQWTCEWWDDRRHQYDVLTSIPVLDELESGDHPHKDQEPRLTGHLVS